MRLFVLLGLCLATTAFAETHGIVRSVHGDVKIKSIKSGQTAPAKLDQDIVEKDTIIAGADGMAKIIMDDNNAFSIRPNTTVEIVTYSHEEAANQRSVELFLTAGQIRVEVHRRYEGPNRFQLKTPSAVCGVRGTDFLISFDAEKSISEVVTFKGEVEFGRPGSDGQINDSVKVSAGSRSTIEKSGHPLPPEHLQPKELRRIERQTNHDKGAKKEDRSERANKKERHSH